MNRIALALTTFLAVPVMAQTSPADPAVSGARALWESVTGYIVKSAEQMPESDYAFRPVATVRTFGQLVGHVAGAQYMYCAAATGDAPRGEGDVEKTVTTKAGLVAAIKASTEYCRKAYAQTDAASAAPIKLFERDRTRLYALMGNASHNSEHYGNIVTYLRIKGMIPPSSQQAPAQ